MESKTPGPSKGYQKQIKKDAQPKPKPRSSQSSDYSSPTAKKWPQFMEALQTGNSETVKQLIEEGINVNILRESATPLMVAASKGQTGIAEIILQAGANINEKNEDGWTALHKAAYEQDKTEIIDLLMQSGSDVEAKNRFGKTPLQLAEEKNHRDIVRVIKNHLQQQSLDVQEWEDFLNTADGKPYKQTRRYESLAPLFKFWWLPPVVLGVAGLLIGFLSGLAFLLCIIGMVSGALAGLGIFLWERNLRAYLDGLGPLPHLDIHLLRQKRKAGESLAVAGKQKSEPTDAETGGESPGNPGETGAFQAVLDQTNPDELLKDRGRTEARKTIGRRKLEIGIYAAIAVLAILAITALFYRNSIVQWYSAKKLERNGIQLSERAFLAEVSQNNEEAVNLFINAGISLAAKDEQGRTALMIAAERENIPILKKLIKCDPALLNSADSNGYTALMTAARQGRSTTVALLLENGADVNYQVPSAESAATALQAVLNTPDFKDEHMNILQKLLQQGAQVKARNKAGHFPLLFAAEHGYTKAAVALLEQGANINDVTPSGQFPLMVAACKGYFDFIATLAVKGANMTMALPDGKTPLMCAAQEGHVSTIRVLLENGVDINAKTAGGATALTEATRAGRIEAIPLLLEQGADPGGAYVPDSFLALQGKSVAVNAKKDKSGDVLKRIGKQAGLDGYVMNDRTGKEQKITASLKGPWNKMLAELAKKNRLVLAVKERDVFVWSSAPAAVKRDAGATR